MLAVMPLNPPMDPFGYQKHDPDRLAETASRHDRLATPSNRQVQQLPSLREVRTLPYPTRAPAKESSKQVILPSLHEAIDDTTITEVTRSNRLPQLRTSGLPPIGRPPGSNLTSPISSHSTSMPDSFDELGQKNYDSINHFGPHKPLPSWPGTSNYQDMATSYAQRQPLYHQGIGHMKHESGLPPIRDMGFVSPTIPSPSYNNVFNTSPQGPVPMDYGPPFRRPSYNDGRGLSQTFPPYQRPYSMDKYEPGFRSQNVPHMVYSQPSYNDYSPSYHSTLNHQPFHGLDNDRGSKKRRGNLPKPVTDILRRWLMDHLEHPYPSEDEKQELIVKTGLTIAQV